LKEITSASGETIAIVVEKSFKKQGVNFLSKSDYPLQLGISTYAAGEKIKPHVHLKRNIAINNIQEIVYIKKGSAIVNLYDSNKVPLQSIKLSTGDLIFFVAGGHGFEISKNTTIIEVKQGPYHGKNNDKEFI